VQTWLLTAGISLLFGYWFLKQLEMFLGLQGQLAMQDHPVGLAGYMSVRYMEPLSLLFTFIAPLFAMRSFSDEFRRETYALWQSSPVSHSALVLGKFLGIMLVNGTLVLLAVMLPLLLRLAVPLDTPVLVSASIGLLGCTCLCAACAMFFSSLTRHALIAVTASIALLTILWMFGSAATNSTSSLQWLAGLAIGTHLRGFFQGYIQTKDIAYFALLTLLFLALTVIRLDSLRQTGQ
jgi:ABC-2 type transport system permease protein